ncbi:hypothetical protein DPM19_27940 [Actinomadura craniellae]|uniref:DUF11 domain-containing protein n=1 Tax=Actinomadura craniellae TaxID=2231787 RepID=A0A365GY98_9ACTN|nr:DUF11 domain-containing protein [Actinomadura craniellae]RAY11815.1 hypothetical protein DPM19_27940 [Actinomadura craniellae]
MQSTILGRSAVPLLAAAAVLVMPPAHAGQRLGEMNFDYSTPRVAADGEHVSWQWTVTNNGKADVADVQVVHRLIPALKVTKVPTGCSIMSDTVQCRYDRIAAGARRSGTIEVELPSVEQGEARISGRLTWREADAKGQPATAPVLETSTTQPQGRQPS